MYSLFFVDARHGWAAGQGGLVVRTTDGGLNWQEEHVPSEYVLLTVAFADTTIGWAAGNELFTTTDGGVSWTIEPDGSVNYLTDVWIISRQEVWVATDYGEFVHTTDGGVSWTVQSAGTNAWISSVMFSDRDHGWAACGEYRPGLLLHTTDAGQAWAEHDCGGIPTLHQVVSAGPQRFVAVGAGGVIVHTTDGGDSWTERSEGPRDYLQAVSFGDPQQGWAVGWGGAIVHTDDGGGSWRRQSSLDGAYYQNVEFVDAERGWITGFTVQLLDDPFGTILFTSDGGQSWNSQREQADEWLAAVDFVSEQYGWAVGRRMINSEFYPSLLKTTNGGIDWLALTLAVPGIHMLWSVDAVNESICWIGADSGTVLHTSDGGIEWQSSTFDPWLSIEDVCALDNQYAWAVATDAEDRSSYIFSTFDGGLTWARQCSLGSTLLHNIEFLDLDNGWAVGEAGCILRTTDGGEHWLHEDSHTLNELIGLCFWDRSRGWTVGGGGTILCFEAEVSAPLDPVPTVPRDPSIAAYPNPFNSQTRVVFDVSTAGRTQVMLYDVMGRLQTALVDRVLPAGHHAAILNGSMLSSGTYFIRLTNHRTSASQKLIFLK